MGEFSSSDTSESSVPVSVSTVQIFISSPEIYLQKTNKPLSHPMCSGVLSCTETQEYWNGGGRGYLRNCLTHWQEMQDTNPDMQMKLMP